MIAYIKGVVAERLERSLIVDVHGVGYRLLVASSVAQGVSEGDEVMLRVYHHITESDQVLFGFASVRDLEYFELLLTVPSVGPKTALGILDAAPASVLSRAVTDNDLSLLVSIPGIGRRTASRILVELKDKLSHVEPATPGESSSSLKHDTIEALVGLGYSAAKARAAVGMMPADIVSVEDAVKFVLQRHRA